MALNATLGRRNAAARRTRVTATITADKGEGGIKIVLSKLSVTVEGLRGIDAGGFTETAREAEGACPVSNALLGSL